MQNQVQVDELYETMKYNSSRKPLTADQMKDMVNVSKMNIEGIKSELIQ